MQVGALMFTDCPAYLDARGLARCGLPAEIQDPYLVPSTDGPLESVRIRCPRGHCFNGPIESLTRHKNQAQPARARRAARQHQQTGQVGQG
jgi:hypothetical protein